MSINSLFTVLGIGFPPDDLEISCAGTLAKYVEHGHRVVMVCMTDGRHGRSCPPDEMAEIRKQEAEASAALLGAELIMLGYEDLGLEDNLETRAKIVDIIRRFSPGVIITHAPFDLNPDHR
ncbi:MAG: PIG-L family deacetylase, partial [bacterium]|nr:PIG-L family deacetylase [bacterium]